MRSSLCLSLIAAAVAAPAFAKLPPLSEEAKAKAAETAAKTAWNEKAGLYKHCMAIERIAAKYGEGAPGAKGQGQKGTGASAGAAQAATPAGGPAQPAATAGPTAAGTAPTAAGTAPTAASAGSMSQAGATTVAMKDAKPLVPAAAPTGVAPAPAGTGSVMAQVPAGLAPCVDPGPFVPPTATAAAGAAGAVATPGAQVAASGPAAGPAMQVQGAGGKTVVPATPVTAQKDKPIEAAEAHSPPGTAISPPSTRATANELGTGNPKGTGGTGTGGAVAKPTGTGAGTAPVR